LIFSRGHAIQDYSLQDRLQGQVTGTCYKKGDNFMARMARIKFLNPKDGYYHIMSRNVLKSFLLDGSSKEFFLSLMKKLSQVYFTKVATFAIMSNHFHLIVQMIPEDEITEDDASVPFVDIFKMAAVSYGFLFVLIVFLHECVRY
jgi:hypothetical protein